MKLAHTFGANYHEKKTRVRGVFVRVRGVFAAIWRERPYGRGFLRGLPRGLLRGRVLRHQHLVEARPRPLLKELDRLPHARALHRVGRQEWRRPGTSPCPRNESRRKGFSCCCRAGLAEFFEPHPAPPLDPSDLLQEASNIAAVIEQASNRLTPNVIRAARRSEEGRKDLDRMEYALGTIGKALVLTDYTIDEEKDMDKLKAFRESQARDR